MMVVELKDPFERWVMHSTEVEVDGFEDDRLEGTGTARNSQESLNTSNVAFALAVFVSGAVSIMTAAGSGLWRT